MSQFFESGGQSIGASATVNNAAVNMGLLISVLFKFLLSLLHIYLEVDLLIIRYFYVYFF